MSDMSAAFILGYEAYMGGELELSDNPFHVDSKLTPDYDEWVVGFIKAQEEVEGSANNN